MAIIVGTPTPQYLLDSLRDMIKNKVIKTWSIDFEGDFTNTNEKWAYKAWFEPQVDEPNARLAFGIIPNTTYLLTNEIYAVYHGRLASTLLAHFDYMMEELRITPNLDPTYDRY